ncbi:MAG: N-acetyltransferase [Candidatus Omnitrophica bacterium]|nr:N-acetyltransferase [Candidatus Omnitrophota bacterium]
MSNKNIIHKIRKSVVSDAVYIQELINGIAKTGQVLPRSLNNIYENLRDFFVYEKEGRIYGCSALHITWENLAEIRSLVVHDSCRGRGIGRELVDVCCKEAKEFGINKVFLLTEKTVFFGKFGFEPVDKSLLPHKIWSDCVQCIHFPNCQETAMMKNI